MFFVANIGRCLLVTVRCLTPLWLLLCSPNSTAQIQGQPLPPYAHFAAYALLGALLITVVLVSWNIALRRRVQARTAELSNSLEALGQAKQVLEQSLAQLSATLQAVPDLLFEMDLDGRYYSTHSPRTDLLAVPATVFLGKLVSEVMPTEAAEVVLAALKEANELGYSNGQQMMLALPQGHKWFELSVARMPTPQTRGPHFIVLSRDVTERKQSQQQLDRLYYAQKAMLENDLVGLVRVANRIILWANPAFEKMLGYDPGELVGTATRQTYPDQQAYLDLAQAAYPALAAGQIYRAQSQHVRKDGARIWVEMSGSVLRPGSGESLWVFLDITERRQAEDKLRTLSRITEQAPMAIVITDLAGTIEYTNPWVTQVTGYAPEEIQGQNPRILQSGQTPPPVHLDLWQTLKAGSVWRGEFHNRKKNGDIFVEQAVIAPVLDSNGHATHYVALKEDITERKRAERALQTSLREKVALLHEVHHRVKNNLQVVTSLLRLEAGRSSHPDTKSVLKDMQARIHSMALLHESLYRSSNFTSVDLDAYIKQVAIQTFRARASASSSARLQLELAPVKVSLDHATLCGLLVNELLSNSLKHGFPESHSGDIRIELQAHAGADGGPASCCLRVSDSGIGLPDDFEARRGQSLGLQLVSDLARQLGGTLETGSGPGAVFVVSFAVEEPRAAATAL